MSLLHSSSVGRLALCGLLSMLMLLTVGLVSASASVDLFISAGSESLLEGTMRPAVKRFRPVTVRTGLLAVRDTMDTKEETPGPIRLNLFKGVSFMARTATVKTVSAGRTVWKGSLEGVPDSEVTLVVNGSRLTGNVVLPGAFYQVRPLSSGLHAVLEVDRRAYPPEKDPRPALPVDSGTRLDGTAPPTDVSVSAGPYRLHLPMILTPPILKVLVVYTPAARQSAGGSAHLADLIQLALSESNTGLTNSGIELQMQLAHAQEVFYDEFGFDWDVTLDRLTGKNDGYLDQVHGLRDLYKADVVVLLVDEGSFCGQGWLMTTVSAAFAAHAFSLVNWDCATGNYSFAHEIGHNLGSHHDWAETSETGAYSYSKGYQAPNGAFRTIMAYDTNCPGICPRINYWSNPDVSYQGQPTGRYFQGFEPADNRRSISNTTPTASNWR